MVDALLEVFDGLIPRRSKSAAGSPAFGMVLTPNVTLAVFMSGPAFARIDATMIGLRLNSPRFALRVKSQRWLPESVMCPTLFKDARDSSGDVLTFNKTPIPSNPEDLRQASTAQRPSRL
ncbi:hypothetical protein ANRL2_04099 [Anaerolineae bacterium]|nr:hypothetical protein ANRL2_04099 [Anaerolineae bacterium]